jgi:hypothetical protein
MSDNEQVETVKRERKKNPYSQYAKARAHADKVRRANGRASALAEKAAQAAEKAAALAAQLPEAEAAEQEALEALQAALEELDGDIVDDTGVEDDSE